MAYLQVIPFKNMFHGHADHHTGRRILSSYSVAETRYLISFQFINYDVALGPHLLA